MQILHHLYKRLEHLQILVSLGILEPIHCGYQGMPVVDLLGLCKNVPLPPPPLFSGLSASCNLLQRSGFFFFSFEHALSPVGSLLSNPWHPYSIAASNYHSNRSMWCLCVLSETKHLLGKNHTHTR